MNVERLKRLKEKLDNRMQDFFRFPTKEESVTSFVHKKGCSRLTNLVVEDAPVYANMPFHPMFQFAVPNIKIIKCGECKVEKNFAEGVVIR